MKEYLNKFGTLDEYNNFKESSSFISPDVSYVAANSIVKYTPNENYLIATFNIDNDYVDEPFEIGGWGASDADIIEIDSTPVTDSDITWMESRPYYTFNTTGEHTVAFKLPEDEEGSYIPNYLLAEVDYLIETKIPEGPDSIGIEALSLAGDSEYNTVNFNIPSSVKQIHDFAFYYYCSLPLYIIFNSIVPPTLVFDRHEDWFDNQIIYVPKNAVSTYKAASYWSYYASQIFPIPDYPIDIREENKIEYKATAKLSFNTPRISGANIIRHDYGNDGKGTIYLDKAIDILDRSFWGKTTLLEVLLPDSVKDIEREAFVNCTNLTTVNLPLEMVEIKYMTFSGCQKLVELGSLDNIKSIGDGAFEGCIMFKDDNFVGNLEYIGNDAFFNTGFTTVSFSDNLRFLGSLSFRNCTNLEHIRIPKHFRYITHYKWDSILSCFPGCSKLQTAGPGDEYNIDIGEFDKEIPAYLFSLCSITSVTFPNGLKKIGEEAFSSCSNLTKIEIPKGTVEIGKMAFAYCDNLNDITIPETVITMGEGVFYRVNGMYRSAGPIEGSGNYHIKFGWKTKIPNYAFMNALLGSISLPNTLLEIGKYAFLWNNGITLLSLPSSLLTIGKNAFYYCKSLSTITGGINIRNIEESAFEECTNLASLPYFTELKHIGKKAFMKCKFSLFNLYYKLTSIGKEAFKECSYLTTANFNSARVKTILNGAFSQCPSLRTLYISDNIHKIVDYAFYKCSNLTGQIELGSNVKELGNYIFKDTAVLSIKLKTIVPPTIKDHTFDNSIQYYIFVPNNSLNTYKTAWPQVANRIIGYNP